MKKLLLAIMLGLLMFASTPVALAQSKDKEPDRKQMEKDLEAMRKKLDVTGDTAKVVKIIADVVKLAAPGKGVSALSKTMGTISTSAKEGEKLIKKIQEADEDDRPALVKKEQSNLEKYIKAAVNPLKELERVKEEVRAVQIPMLDCSEKGHCVTLDDLLNNKKRAAEKAYKQHQAFEASLKKLKELKSFFQEMSTRAAGANKALTALAKGWEDSLKVGCGILGSYCGIKSLEATELAYQCNAIKSAADSKLKDVERALKEEQTRYDNWKGNMKDLFGIDVTKKPS